MLFSMPSPGSSSTAAMFAAAKNRMKSLSARMAKSWRFANTITNT